MRYTMQFGLLYTLDMGSAGAAVLAWTSALTALGFCLVAGVFEDFLARFQEMNREKPLDEESQKLVDRLSKATDSVIKRIKKRGAESASANEDDVLASMRLDRMSHFTAPGWIADTFDDGRGRLFAADDQAAFEEDEEEDDDEGESWRGDDKKSNDDDSDAPEDEYRSSNFAGAFFAARNYPPDVLDEDGRPKSRKSKEPSRWSREHREGKANDQGADDDSAESDSVLDREQFFSHEYVMDESVPLATRIEYCRRFTEEEENEEARSFWAALLVQKSGEADNARDMFDALNQADRLLTEVDDETSFADSQIYYLRANTLLGLGAAYLAFDVETPPDLPDAIVERITRWSEKAPGSDFKLHLSHAYLLQGRLKADAGLDEPTLTAYANARRCVDELIEEHPGDRKYTRELNYVLVSQSQTFLRIGDYERGVNLLKEACENAEKNGDHVGFLAQHADSAINLYGLLRSLGRRDEANEYLEKAVVAGQRLCAYDPDKYCVAYARALLLKAPVRENAGDRAEAVACADRAEEVLRNFLAGSAPLAQRVAAYSQMSEALLARSATRRRNKDWNGSHNDLLESLRYLLMATDKDESFVPEPLMLRILAAAVLLVTTKERAVAIKKVVEVAERLIDAMPVESRKGRVIPLADALMDSHQLCRSLGETKSATAAIDAVISVLTKAAENKEDLEAARDLANAYYRRGEHKLFDFTDSDLARTDYGVAVKMCKELIINGAADSDTESLAALVMMRYVCSGVRKGNFDEARELLTMAVNIVTARLRDGDWTFAFTLEVLTSVTISVAREMPDGPDPLRLARIWLKYAARLRKKYVGKYWKSDEDGEDSVESRRTLTWIENASLMARLLRVKYLQNADPKDIDNRRLPNDMTILVSAYSSRPLAEEPYGGVLFYGYDVLEYRNGLFDFLDELTKTDRVAATIVSDVLLVSRALLRRVENYETEKISALPEAVHSLVAAFLQNGKSKLALGAVQTFVLSLLKIDSWVLKAYYAPNHESETSLLPEDPKEKRKRVAVDTQDEPYLVLLKMFRDCYDFAGRVYSIFLDKKTALPFKKYEDDSFQLSAFFRNDPKFAPCEVKELPDLPVFEGEDEEKIRALCLTSAETLFKQSSRAQYLLMRKAGGEVPNDDYKAWSESVFQFAKWQFDSGRKEDMFEWLKFARRALNRYPSKDAPVNEKLAMILYGLTRYMLDLGNYALDKMGDMKLTKSILIEFRDKVVKFFKMAAGESKILKEYESLLRRYDVKLCKATKTVPAHYVARLQRDVHKMEAPGGEPGHIWDRFEEMKFAFDNGDRRTRAKVARLGWRVVRRINRDRDQYTMASWVIWTFAARAAEVQRELGKNWYTVRRYSGIADPWFDEVVDVYDLAIFTCFSAEDILENVRKQCRAWTKFGSHWRVMRQLEQGGEFITKFIAFITERSREEEDLDPHRRLRNSFWASAAVAAFECERLDDCAYYYGMYDPDLKMEEFGGGGLESAVRLVGLLALKANGASGDFETEIPAAYAALERDAEGADKNVRSLIFYRLALAAAFEGQNDRAIGYAEKALETFEARPAAELKGEEGENEIWFGVRRILVKALCDRAQDGDLERAQAILAEAFAAATANYAAKNFSVKYLHGEMMILQAKLFLKQNRSEEALAFARRAERIAKQSEYREIQELRPTLRKELDAALADEERTSEQDPIDE